MYQIDQERLKYSIMEKNGYPTFRFSNNLKGNATKHFIVPFERILHLLVYFVKYFN